jgi:spermidine synthase
MEENTIRCLDLPDFFQEVDGELWLVEEERGNMRIQYRVKEVLLSEDTPYQHISIIDTYDFGRCLVLDGIMQTTELDSHMYNEMVAHVPVATHKNPKGILIIGAGACGVINELTKYSFIERIDVVEIDETVVQESVNKLQCIAGNGFSDERVHFFFEDGSKFIKDKQNYYDIVIIDSSDPIGPSRILYSEEFYKDVKAALREDGLMICQSESPLFYKDILKTIRGRLKKLFPIIKSYKLIVPCFPGGLWTLTMASKKYDPEDADADLLPSNTKHINKEILKSCFDLPNFMKDDLE